MTDLAVLIAGTSSSYLEISRKMLKSYYENCQVEFANSGKECIEKAQAKEYKLILFDYQLGDMTGLEIIEVLIAAGSKSPLIILIEEGDEVKAIKALEKGAADYILKVRGYLTSLPFTLRNILEKSSVNLNIAQLVTGDKPIGGLLSASSETEGYFVLDRKGRIISSSSDIEKLTELSEAELLELSFSDLIPREREKSFFEWLGKVAENGHANKPLETEVVNKQGERLPLQVVFTPVRDSQQNVQRYQGKVYRSNSDFPASKSTPDKIDQIKLASELSRIITTCNDEPIPVFLNKLAELTSQFFHFERATVAILDKTKQAFIKQAMVGYDSFPHSGDESIEVPAEVIERTFSNRFRVKVIYYNQDHRELASSINSKFPERRTQRRRPLSQWHPRDLVLVNLMNRENETFGYISLDRPVAQFIPTRDTFHNLELFGQLVSFALENYHRFSLLEKRSRRLKQMLVSCNIFKLHLSLNELLQEVVWSVHFSTDFNLVGLGLISKRSGSLEIKSIACKDKVKTQHLKRLRIPLEQLSELLTEEYARGKSYFINKDEKAIQPLKNIYYASKTPEMTASGQWPSSGLLVIPIKSNRGKIIGVLFVDDPMNQKMPEDEVIKTLEIIANQIAVAIDNRILYLTAKQKKNGKAKRAERVRDEIIPKLNVRPRKDRFIDRFFK